MAQTVSATVNGRLTSRVAAALMCQPALASLDVLTVVHGLGISPTQVYATIRSQIVSDLSFGTPALSVRSWNASQAIIDLLSPSQATGAKASVLIDVWCEVTATIIA